MPAPTTPLDMLDALSSLVLANWQLVVLAVAAFAALLFGTFQWLRLIRLRRQLADRHWLADRTLTVAIASTRATRRSHGGLRLVANPAERGGGQRLAKATARPGEAKADAPAAPAHFRLVRIYIDHSNFYQYWKQLVVPIGPAANGPVSPIDWAKLPEALLGALRRLPAFHGQEFVYCGAHVYGSYYENEYYDLLHNVAAGKAKPALPFGKRIEDIEAWRRENQIIERDLVDDLPQKFGYFVFPFRRRTPQQLKSAHYSASGVPLAQEKGLDVRLCTDLMADAVFDVFDIALIVSNDADFIPAVEFVQNELGKTVVHVGFRQFASGLRDVCRGYIVLNDAHNVAQSMRRGGT